MANSNHGVLRQIKRLPNAVRNYSQLRRRASFVEKLEALEAIIGHSQKLSAQFPTSSKEIKITSQIRTARLDLAHSVKNAKHTFSLNLTHLENKNYRAIDNLDALAFGYIYIGRELLAHPVKSKLNLYKNVDQLVSTKLEELLRDPNVSSNDPLLKAFKDLNELVSKTIQGEIPRITQGVLETISSFKPNQTPAMPALELLIAA